MNCNLEFDCIWQSQLHTLLVCGILCMSLLLCIKIYFIYKNSKIKDKKENT